MKEIHYKRRFPAENYRLLKRGLIVLPEMEKRLVLDLRRLVRLIDGKRLTDLEISFATQSIQIVLEVVDETITALRALRDFLSPRILENVDDFENILREFVPELSPPMQSEIFQIVRAYGSVGAMFSSAVSRLEFKRNSLSDNLELIAQGTKENLDKATQNLQDIYLEKKEERYPRIDAPLETFDQLVEKWKAWLDDAQKEIENAKSYWDTQDAEDKYYRLLELLCYSYPEVAKRLGLEETCEKIDRHELLCMLICGPLFCFIVVVIVIACSNDCSG